MNPLCFAYSMSGAAGIRSSFAVLAVACAVNMGYLHPPDSLMWVGSGWVLTICLSRPKLAHESFERGSRGREGSTRTFLEAPVSRETKRCSATQASRSPTCRWR